MRAYSHLAILTSLLVVTGCGMEGPVPSEGKPAAPVAESTPASTAAPTTAATAAATRPSTETPVVATADVKPTTAAAPVAKATGTLEEAHVGMGARGRGYGGGLIAVSVASLFATKERVSLMQMDQALNMYKGEHGYYPKTYAEFKKEIIEANSIKLPELPEGQKYEYDPQDGKLMVRMPASDAPNGP